MSKKMRSTWLDFRNARASSASSKVASRFRNGSRSAYSFVRSSARGSSSTMMQLIFIERQLHPVSLPAVVHGQRMFTGIGQGQPPPYHLVPHAAEVLPVGRARAV